jgi:general nucleoside transport system permease protein
VSWRSISGAGSVMRADFVTGAALAAFLEATVRIATPLGLAAVGETVTERSGVINIGVEGAMLTGALASALAAWTTHSVVVGFFGGVLAGLLVALVFAWFAIGMKADQIVVGTAITIGATGLTGAVYRAAFGAGGAALSLPTTGRQSVLTWILVITAALAWWTLRRTSLGLALRAAGDAPEAARAAGLRVERLRLGATLFGGAMAGLAGATLVLAQAGTFAERMTAGRGFIAIAIVVLGRWNPLGALAAALVFGAASALQYVFQTLGMDVPYQFFLMAPYVVSLLALAGVGGRARAPAALGRP